MGADREYINTSELAKVRIKVKDCIEFLKQRSQ